MKNSEIAGVFQEIAQLLKLKGENPFKIRAYQKAAQSIEQLPVAAEQLVSEDRLREIPGVGEAITKKITELVTTGHLDYYQKLKTEFPVETSALPDAVAIDAQTALLPASELANRIVATLKAAITSGKHWYLALLEAIGAWTAAEETDNGRSYHYLIAGEAFDWLLLAERLCQAVDELLPAAEQTALLFHNKPPLNLSGEKFRELIGSSKYRQYLNYFYGITVEEALILAVQEEIRKERRTSGYNKDDNTTNEAYRRIYGATKAILLKRFRKEKDYPQLKSTSLTELKEFTYWLFKYRLKHCDKAKVASDTRKALNRLQSNGFSKKLAGTNLKLEFSDVIPAND